MIQHPYNIPTSDIDMEYPCGDCQIYKGGPDACLDCPVMERYLILTGDSEPAQYCPECDWVLPEDKFYPTGTFMFHTCGAALELIKRRKGTK